MQNSFGNLTNINDHNLIGINNSFEKSVVHAHQRKTKSGKLSNVKEYSDSRTKQPETNYIKESKAEQKSVNASFGTINGKIDFNGKEINYRTDLEIETYDHWSRLSNSKKEDLKNRDKQIVRLGKGKYIVFSTNFKINDKNVDRDMLKTFLGNEYNKITTQINKDAIIKYNEVLKEKKILQEKARAEEYDKNFVVKHLDDFKNENEDIKNYIKAGKLKIKLTDRQQFIDKKTGDRPKVYFMDENDKKLYSVSYDEHKTYPRGYSINGISHGNKFFIDGIKDRDTRANTLKGALRKIANNYEEKQKAENLKKQKAEEASNELQDMKNFFGYDIEQKTKSRYDYNRKYIGEEKGYYKIKDVDYQNEGASITLKKNSYYENGNKSGSYYTIYSTDMNLSSENYKKLLNIIIDSVDNGKDNFNKLNIKELALSESGAKKVTDFIMKNSKPIKINDLSL